MLGEFAYECNIFPRAARSSNESSHLSEHYTQFSRQAAGTSLEHASNVADAVLVRVDPTQELKWKNFSANQDERLRQGQHQRFYSYKSKYKVTSVNHALLFTLLILL